MNRNIQERALPGTWNKYNQACFKCLRFFAMSWSLWTPELDAVEGCELYQLVRKCLCKWWDGFLRSRVITAHASNIGAFSHFQPPSGLWWLIVFKICVWREGGRAQLCILTDAVTCLCEEFWQSRRCRCLWLHAWSRRKFLKDKDRGSTETARPTLQTWKIENTFST